MDQPRSQPLSAAAPSPDLVRELRSARSQEDAFRVIYRAANEIEELRAAVALLWDYMPDDQCIAVSFGSPDFYMVAQREWQRAREAAGS